MNTFDVLIIGGGAAGMSCALVLGSAKNKAFTIDKTIGIIMHQKASALVSGLFNNVLGLKAGTTGKEILEKGKQQLSETYPHIIQIEQEKVQKIEGTKGNFTVITNKNQYQAKIIVIAVGPSNLFNIEGLLQYVAPHQKLPPAKERIQLKNNDHKVTDGIYVAGVLAGWRSQFAIACGSGASVATDILTEWNNGNPAMVHDKID
ncbi:MAG TPA: pyridine nucleotide-disulfide oxidoreductase [Flavobacteriaceae bacterium]|jgi:thioredoxin reductase|nr:pyridine nucleotide-disulfide oxidoreductase [Flavobacteriaceae bacterium]HBS11817.1 pyridine nucleotide-disulfide oxidoreductase [Flavobacteriaceae bacterium]